MFTRRNLIYALIATALLLIVVNISFEVVSQKTEVKKLSVTKIKIENKLAKTLENYGISSEWIKKVYVKNPLSDSLNYLFNISIPEEVTIATLIKDINKSFIFQPVKIETIERKNHSNTILKIYSNKILKLQANLDHSRKTKRDFAEYSFLVFINTDDNQTPVEKTDKIYFDFNYLIVPTKKSTELKNSFNRNYAVLLNDQISDSDFELKEDFSKQTLINNIRTIILTFGKDKLYLIDETSALYDSKIYSLLRDEFGSRGIHLKSLQKYPKIEGNNFEQLNSLFNFYTTSMKGKEGKSFIIELNNFILLNPAIENQIKKGDKVISP